MKPTGLVSGLQVLVALRRESKRRWLPPPSPPLAAALIGALLAFLALPPAMATLGNEFQVNTYTTGDQDTPAIAMDANGNFVVVWSSSVQDDGGGWGIFGQRYDATGTPQGSEFQVNTFTTGDQFLPAVAMDTAGNFVVVWNSEFQDGSGWGIFAQRYDATGTPPGSEVQVNTYTTDNQALPAVAMDADGDFVVVWRSDGQDGSAWGIFGQRYDAAGTPQGSEFQVNTYTTSDQSSPSVAMDPNGNFVVVWESYGQDGFNSGVFGQRFDASGTPQGAEFQVNAYALSSDSDPAIAMDPNGNFVVTWAGGQDGDPDGIFAQRYDAAGVPQGIEFQVNTFTTSIQGWPAAAMDADGNFVVVWRSPYGIFAQRYDASGAPQGGEFHVNTYALGNHAHPAVVMDADGNFVVVWRSDGGDGSGYAIFGRSFPGTFIPDATFTGKVKDVAKQPLAGATIEAKQGGITLFSTVTAANGSYTLQVAAGTYDLVAWLASYLDATKTLTINAGQTLTEVKFKLFRLSFFEGTVTEKGTGTPLDGALVEAIRNGATVASTMTAYDGSYILQVTKGTYNLRASKTGYKTKQKLDQTIGDGATKTVNIALPLLP